MKAWRIVILSVVVVALAGPLFADAYILIPGVSGESVVKGRKGWSDVDSHTLLVTPPLAEKGKSVVNQCSATIQSFLGSAAGTVVGLVGTPLGGDVVIETDRLTTGAPILASRAILRGAVIDAVSGGSPTLSSAVSIRFAVVELTTWATAADGSQGPPQTGRFDCTIPR